MNTTPFLHRRFAPLAGVALATALAATACGGGDGDSEAVTEVPDGEEVTITFMHAMSSGALNESLTFLTDQFNDEHDNITVELLEETGYSELNNRIEAEVAAGNAPTIAQAYSSWAVPLMDADVIVPLDDLVTESEHYDSFYQGIQEDMQMADGQHWMWPFNKSLYVQFYNPEMISEAPETWTEFQEVSEEVSDGDVVAWTMDPGGASGPGAGSEVVSLTAQSNGVAPFDDEGYPQFDEPTVIDALQFYADMLDEGALETGEGYPGQENLGAGVGAFDLSTIAGLYYQLEAVGDAFELGIAPLPEGSDSAGNILSGTNIVMFADAEDAEQAAAWTYMEYLASPEIMAQWSADTGYLPVSSEATETELYQDYIAENPWAEGVIEQLDSAWSPTPQPWTQEAQGLFAVAVSETLTGSATAEEALSDAQASAEALAE